MSVAAHSDFTCTTVPMANDINGETPLSENQHAPEDKGVTGDSKGLETHAAWALEETESSIADGDAWSSRGHGGVGGLTPGDWTAQGVHKTGNARETHTNNQGTDNSTVKGNGTGSDVASSPDSKPHLNSNYKSDKIIHTKKFVYLSEVPEPVMEEPRVASNTSLVSRDKTFHGLNGLTHAPSFRHWEGSQGSLCRHNTSCSLKSEGKHPQRSQNGTKLWEGVRHVDVHHVTPSRQKTILDNAHAHNDQHVRHVTPTSVGFSRSKTMASIPSKGSQAKDSKRDQSAYLSPSMLVTRMTSHSDMDLSKKPSKSNTQIENEPPKNFDLSHAHPKLTEKPSPLQIGPKFEYKVPKAMIPKKGLIKLTALAKEQKNPAMYDEYLKEKDTSGFMKSFGLSSKHIGRKVKPLPLSHKKLVTKQRVILEHQQAHEDRERDHQDWISELSQTKQNLTIEDLQMGILNFETPAQSRRKMNADADTVNQVVTPDEAEDKSSQVLPLTPREIHLPPLRT